MNLKGKTCLITGGTRGIGAATAMALAEAGANVAIVGRRSDSEATETRNRLQALGQQCELISADCSKPDDLKRCVRSTVDRFGTVDVMVHSAGGLVKGGLFQITEQDWKSAFDIHVHGIFYLCREVIPHMQKKKEGAIVLSHLPRASVGLSRISLIRWSKARYRSLHARSPESLRTITFGSIASLRESSEQPFTRK
jgi:NAD(P)-dependent dehydrogenase (short-subunit alcohol dehydrogenase family)